jgi:hypothetical protein
MSGKLAAALMAATVLALGAPHGVFADPPAAMKLSDPAVFVHPSRPAVRFTHADHAALQGVTCLTCHHVFEKGKNILDPSTIAVDADPSLACALCHISPQALQKAFHLGCITCHDTEKRKGGVTGPRTCGECHAWDK